MFLPIGSDADTDATDGACANDSNDCDDRTSAIKTRSAVIRRHLRKCRLHMYILLGSAPTSSHGLFSWLDDEDGDAGRFDLCGHASLAGLLGRASVMEEGQALEILGVFGRALR